MVWITIGFITTICFFLLIWRGVKGPSHTLKTIGGPISDLLKRGYNDGFLIIDISHSKYFLQLRKYIHSRGNYGIELHFPNVEWSERLFKKLTSFCKRAGIQYTIAEEKADIPIEFLHIDFEKDVFRAHNTIKNIILKVFKLDESVKLFVRLENATVDDELIDN